MHTHGGLNHDDGFIRVNAAGDERGGHFAAMERPQDYINDVRAFGREIFG